MRTRTTVTGSFSTVPRFRQTRSCGGAYGAPSTIALFETGTVTTKTITDVVVPHFKTLLNCNPQAILPFNPVVITTSVDTRIPGNNTVDNRPITCATATRHDYGPESFGSFLLPEPVIPQAAINAVVLEACAKARASIHDSLTDLAELPSTVALFVSTAKRFAILKKDVHKRALFLWNRKTRKQKFHSFSDALASAWLEFRYGWMPIVYSLQDIQKAISVSDRGMVRERSSSTMSLSETKSQTSLVDSSRATWTQTTTLTGSITVRGYALGVFENGSGRFGMDPVITGYELITLSFVADWFFTIGAWLQTWSPFSAGKLALSGYSIKEEWELVRSGSITYFGTNIGGSISTGGGTTGTRSLKVTRYTRMPMAPPYLPGFSLNMNWKRNIDLMALLYKLFK